MMKLVIVNTIVVLLFLVGCNNPMDNTTNSVGVYETSREIIIDKHDGAEGYEAMRWLTAPMDYEDPNTEFMDSAVEIEEVWTILDSLDWKKGQESTSRPAEFRFETIDNREEERVTTVYFLWITADNKNIKLVNKKESVQAQLNETDSEKLYNLLVDRDLTDREITE